MLKVSYSKLFESIDFEQADGKIDEAQTGTVEHVVPKVGLADP
jgi:hypothetical protein